MSDVYHFQANTLDSWLINGAGHGGYDATNPPDGGKNRRQIKKTVYQQDTHLLRSDRQTAIATSQDMERNFATVAWAIRKHLDYVSSFRFKAVGGSKAWRTQLEQWYKNWGTRFNSDVRQRHSFRRQIRLAEARRTVDGDFFFGKVAGTSGSRGKLDHIEGYRIADPFTNMTSVELEDHGLVRDRWANGVELNNLGAARRYAVFSRSINTGTAHFERFIRADKLTPVCYYQRFDQVRGISPLLTGLQSFIDCSDNISMQQAKMRVSALFGLALYRDAVEAEDAHAGPEPLEDSDGDGIADSHYKFDFSGGPQMMDLLPGDRAEFLESKTPPAEAVAFLRFLLNLALKTLDLPDSFLREGETNFFGSRAALMLYKAACVDKQKDMTEALDEILRWRIGMAIRDGDLLPPKNMDFQRINWMWIPTGFPWAWDPVKEATGTRMAVEMGVENIERAAAMNGTDFEENVDINKRAFDYMAKADVQIPWMNQAPEPVNPDETDEQQDMEDELENVPTTSE